MTSIEGRTFLLAKKIDTSFQKYRGKDLKAPPQFGGTRPSGEHPAPRPSADEVLPY